MDHVGLDRQVLLNEFGRIGVVGHDAANFCRGKKNVFRLLPLKKFPGCLLISQIKLNVRVRDNVHMTCRSEAPNNG